MKTYIKTIIVFILIMMFLLVSVISANSNNLNNYLNNDIELRIQGFPQAFPGIAMIVNSNLNHDITAEYYVTSKPIFRNKEPINQTDNFTAFANKYTVTTCKVPFGIRTVYAFLSVGNKSMAREGISIFGFVIFSK